MLRRAVNHYRNLTTPTILVSLAIVVPGCGVDVNYLLGAASGQWDLLVKAVPIEDAIASGTLPEETGEKLSVILDVREYAGEVMALNVGANYRKFYDSGGAPVLFNISASRKEAFAPKLWRFPFFGAFPYIGYFDELAADAEYDSLVDEGLDVFVYEVDAYSGIGFIPNLILSPMLERSDIGIVETVIHELLHSTVWKVDATSFNESLATFYGRTGAVHYLRDRYPDDPELIDEALSFYEDSDRFTNFLLSVYEELDAYYSSDLSSAEKIEGREALVAAAGERFAAEVQPRMNRPERYEWAVDLPVNNAWMLGIRRYNLELELFEQVFADTGEDWHAALERFRTASRADDPYAYLRESLAESTASARGRDGRDRPNPANALPMSDGSASPPPSVSVRWLIPVTGCPGPSMHDAPSR